MTTLYVAEFATVGGTSNFGVAGGLVPPIREQTCTIAATSTPVSSGFTQNTAFVRLHSDSICSVAFGTTPTASTSTMRMAAGQTEYFAVAPGQKVAAIVNT